MTKSNSILEKIAEALVKVGDNVRGAHYLSRHTK